METKKNSKKVEIDPKNSGKKISRKEAFKKGGKYALITAAATMLILSPKKSQAGS